MLFIANQDTQLASVASIQKKPEESKKEEMKIQ
jgi:hypothetical protein